MLYALIIDGSVFQLLSPETAIDTLFAPSMPWTDVTNVIPTPEVGWTFNGTTFAAPPPPPAPTPAQLAAAAYSAFIAGGLTVTSTGTPALSGLYAIDDQSQTDIATEAQFISTFSEFTTGATTNLPWPMPSGSVVVFPTTTAFLSFAKVAGQAVAAAKLALATSAAMPPSTATIP